MTEEEQEEVRKRLLGCIDSGNFEIATPEQQSKTGDYIDYQLIADISDEESWESERSAKAEQDAGCYDDPPYGGFYEDLKEYKNE